MRCYGFARGLMGLLLSVLASLPAAAQCPPDALGTSREIAIDARGGPRFGHVQYPGPQLLEPGEVVLTFDDGPHRQLTPTVLAALDAHCVKATFFIVGQRALLYPGIVREVARRGHTIATHTWSHRNLGGLSPDNGIAEIELGISAVQRALGKPAAPFFRFPYLSDPGYAIRHLKDRNTAIFSIDVDSLDFRTRSPSVVLRNVMKKLEVKRRGILLFHDIQPSTAGALGALLSDLKAKGFRVVHLVPAGKQTTIAAYDARVDGRPLGLTAAPPITQRAAVNPAWEPRALPAPSPEPAVAASAGAQIAPSPQPVPVAPPSRSDDWQRNVFSGN